MRHVVVRLLALGFVCGFLAGCGYRVAGGRELYPDGIATVAIPTVANETHHRGSTEQLTAALVGHLESRTPYRVESTSRADAVLEVTITDIRRRTTSRDRGTALPEEQLLVVLADVLWKDLRNGTVLLRLDNFEQTAALYPTLGESDFFASQEAAEQLAMGIVEAMGDDW